MKTERYCFEELFREDVLVKFKQGRYKGYAARLYGAGWRGEAEWNVREDERTVRPRLTSLPYFRWQGVFRAPKAPRGLGLLGP